jgi:Fe-S cluster assembly protein SufD
MVRIIDNAMKNANPYWETFERQHSEGREPSWVFPLRKAGMAQFAETGFPTTRDEDWRFTNVSAIAKLPFRVSSRPASSPSLPSLSQYPLGELPGARLAFVDGFFEPALSVIPESGDGVVATTLARALASQHPALQQHLGRHAATDHQPFSALNTAFFQDGGFIYVPRGREVELPIQLLFISTGAEPGFITHPRNLVLVEEGGKVTVLETYVSAGGAQHFTNAVTEIVAGDHAAVEHLKFQDENLDAFHVAAVHAHLGRASSTILHSIAAGAKLSRNNIRTVLAGEGLECVLNGLYLTRGDQLADHHMVVEHAEPHCASHEYYNGILDGRSRGVFHGRILVRQRAQKTDAKQTNKNLLLSDDATVDTKPQLEIYADDVKCTHGATIGQLNEESIFYLRARGIGAETARRMLIHAFAGEIIERIRYRPARELLDRLVWDRLEANPLVAERAA